MAALTLHMGATTLTGSSHHPTSYKSNFHHKKIFARIGKMKPTV